MKYNHDRPVEDFQYELEILRRSGFKPIAVSQMVFEDTFLFETEAEAHRAYKQLELEEGSLVGWFYGREDFKQAVEDYEMMSIDDEEKTHVLIHWLS
jgi:hypothetical protein